MNDGKIRITMDDLTRVPPAPPPPPPRPVWGDPGAAPALSNSSVSQSGADSPNTVTVLAVIVVALFLLLLSGGVVCLVALRDKDPGASAQVDYPVVISELLRRDDELLEQVMSLEDWEKADDKDVFLNQAGQSILSYVRMARKFDEAPLPGSFVKAYRDYLDAWEKRGILLKEHPYIGDIFSQMIEGFVAGLTGDFTKLFEKNDQFEAWAESVDATQSEIIERRETLETLAKRYGVKNNQNEPG